MQPTNTNTELPPPPPWLLSTSVVTAVADAQRQSENDLAPLYDVIDPEALDALFAPLADGTTRTQGSVSFHYAGYRVTVSSEGAVELEADEP